MLATISAVVVANNILFSVLSTVATATRLNHTFSKIRSLQVHDVMLLLALICGIGEAMCQIVLTRYGLGQASFEVGLLHAEQFTKLYVTFFTLYFACNMFVKLSLLCFYRLLSRSDRFTWILWTMAVIAVLFGLSSIFVTIFNCVPLSKAWARETPGQCINLEVFFYWNGAFMIVNDIILYVLPILIVREVQLSRSKAMAMNFLFGLGFIVLVASAMRLDAVYKLFTYPERFFWNNAILLVWCTVENHLAIIIICLPAVKTVVVSAATSLNSNTNSLWSNIVKRRKSSLPRGIELPVTSPQPSRKSGQSWWSSSTHKVKSSLSSISASHTHTVAAARRGSADEIQLNKIPSIEVTETAGSSRESMEPYVRSYSETTLPEVSYSTDYRKESV